MSDEPEKKNTGESIAATMVLIGSLLALVGFASAMWKDCAPIAVMIMGAGLCKLGVKYFEKKDKK